ncbi:hypothetical protein PoB_005158400 [Plakobranchus ocellatus]|uniref:TPX2 central domain-containing protein n=1 Tax=Plakobranchus ocellatus TaxID=259542 RepID=A0AAV4C327_9GAST|nr:hypothetical protein PoB_005158400 [Plakobranchus ocellatus]
MTKVKTILAEFCSPKDILAINRLGLLKKEERESQPIPWRHRLPNAERRALVKSEMRMSIRPSRSRVNSIDKAKAFHSAANPKDSRMGECLYSIHIREDPLLGSNLLKINRERSRLEASQKHGRQQFLARSHSLNHEPLLLVEREPSQTVKTRAMLMRQHGIDPQILLNPSYMRPLESQFKPPSTITTIDAFVAETKKKRNVWETAMDEVDPTKFRSAARPCTRLNESEMQQLRLGHAFHKPTPDPTTKPASITHHVPPSIGGAKDSKSRARPKSEDQSIDTRDSVFITQRFAKEDKTVPGKISQTGDEAVGRRSAETVHTTHSTLANKGSMCKTKTLRDGPNKTVTFATTPSVLPDSKSHTYKQARPFTVATDRQSSYKGRIHDKSGTHSKNVREGEREVIPLRTGSKPPLTAVSEKRSVQPDEALRRGNIRGRSMKFLNALLEEPSSP